MQIGNYVFCFVETICPVTENGVIAHFQPQHRYVNKKGLQLHQHGEGSFCKFKLRNASESSGVYAWIIQGERQPIYIGRAVNLKKRFNTGYGNISPKNCFVGGQTTNCKMNKVVLQKYSEGKKIDVYFYATPNYTAVEKELLDCVNTIYNVVNN